MTDQNSNRIKMWPQQVRQFARRRESCVVNDKPLLAGDRVRPQMASLYSVSRHTGTVAKEGAWLGRQF
jgi:hypothetical protein